MSGDRSSPLSPETEPPEGRPGAVAAIALVLTLAGMVLWLEMVAAPWRVASGLVEAGRELQKGENSLSRTALKQAEEHIFAGRAAAVRASRGATGSTALFDIGRLLPGMSAAVDQIDRLVDAAGHSGDAAAGTLSIAKNALRGPNRIIIKDPDDPKGGSIVRLGRIEAIGAAVAAVRADLQAVDRTMDGIEISDLPRRARPEVADARARADEAIEVIADAQAGFEILPGVLGRDEPRTYLIGMQNPAEQRGTGGAILRYSYLTIDEGESELAPGGSVYDIDKERRQIDIDLPADAWYVREIPDAQRFGNANWSPDWPLSAKLMVRYAYAAERFPGVKPVPNFDGVIVIDPVAMEKVIPGTGKFRLFGGGARLTAERAVHYLLYKAYASFPRKGARRTALIDVVQRFEEKMLDPDHPTETVTGMAEALRTKHIQIWMRDPVEQAFVERMDWDGAIKAATRSDYLMVVEQNVGGNKFDYFADQQTSMDIEVTEGGDAKTTTEVRVDNGTFFPQTKHAMGDSSARGPTGERRTPLHEPMMNVYVPRAARLIRAEVAGGRECSAVEVVVEEPCRMDVPEPAAWSDGRPAEHFELGKRVWSATLGIPPQKQGLLRFDSVVPGVVRTEKGRNVYRLVVQHQARVRPDALDVRLSLPEDATDIIAPAFERDGDELVLTKELEEDVEMEVSWRSEA